MTKENRNQNTTRAKKGYIVGILLGLTAVVAGAIGYGKTKKAEEEEPFELEGDFEVESDDEVEVVDSEEE